MAAPYSMDLRERVLAEFDKNEKAIKNIAEIFNVDEKTIYRWRKRRKETGNTQPIMKYQKGHSNKIVDLESFRTFVKNNSDLTTQEMADKLGYVSATTIRRNLKKINFTFKKNNSVIKNAMK